MMERDLVRISIESETADELRKTVESGLYAYNERFVGPMGNSALAIGARSADGKIIGGLVASLQPEWKWMHVHRMWIDESYRGAGIGRRLLEAAEKEAQLRGCLHVAVNTFEFQARGFYEKQGYHVYAVQDDYPVGPTNFLLRKSMTTAWWKSSPATPDTTALPVPMSSMREADPSARQPCSCSGPQRGERSRARLGPGCRQTDPARACRSEKR